MNNETNKQINGIQVDIQIEYKKYLNKKKSKRNQKEIKKKYLHLQNIYFQINFNINIFMTFLHLPVSDC